MKTRLLLLPLPVLTLAMSLGTTARAQDANGLPGTARTTNERILTQTPSTPATTEANRLANAQQQPGHPAHSVMDATMLAEHAVGMAIEGSSLLAIAGPAVPGSTEIDAVKNLRAQARKLLTESQALIEQAATDSRSSGANPAVGRFQTAATIYVSTLATWQSTDPSEIAQVALINQAVKDVLAADHIRQMSSGGTGSAALERLLTHANSMKAQGSELVRRMAVNVNADSSVPINVTSLASRGRILLDAADEVSHVSTSPGTGGPRTGAYPNAGQAPGGSLPRVQSEPSPVPNNSSRTTGSTGGLRPQ